jgi:hypothetical protein
MQLRKKIQTIMPHSKQDLIVKKRSARDFMVTRGMIFGV